MKKTATVFSLLTALTLLPAWAFGQQNYQPAKVTTLTGDTLRGYIDYRGWDKNPRLITFKPDLQAPAQTFRPLDIQGFVVDNEQYRGSRVQIELSSDKLDNLSTSPEPAFRADTTFLRALVSGPRSLYRNKVNGREYLYTEQQGTFDLLVYKLYKPESGYTVIQFNKKFQQQLANYLAACPGMEKQTGVLLYSSSSVQKLFKNYYACTNQQAVISNRKTVFHAGVLVGATRSHLSFDANLTYGPAPVFDTYTQYGPTGGLFFNVGLPGNLGHFSIYNDLLYTSFKTSGMNQVFFGPDNSVTNTVSLSVAYLKLNTLLRFTKPVGAGALFINAGVSNGYALQAKNDRRVVSNFYTSQKTTTGEIFTMQRYESGLVAGIGGSLKRLSGEARYERTGGFLDMVNLSSQFQRYSLLLGYRLF